MCHGLLLSTVFLQLTLIALWVTIHGLYQNHHRFTSASSSSDSSGAPSLEAHTEPSRSVSAKTLSFPIYYTNLDRSTARRAHMERTFGHWGRLIRFPAVDINDEAMIKATVDTHGLTPFEYFVTRGKAKGPGAGALLATKALAAKKAYEDGENLMLLLEDDMTDLLVPFWRFTLDDIVKMADEQHPGWPFIQLQLTLAYPKDLLSWAKNPKSPFVIRTSENVKKPVHGAGAILISREGMKMLIDLLFVGEDGKFDCLPEVESYEPERLVKCNPDNFFWRVRDTSKALLVVPPLFHMMVNEGSTGIRSLTKVVKDTATNDNEEYHFESLVFVLRQSMLALAEKTFQMDFATNMTAKEAGMWYMNQEFPNMVLGFDLAEWIRRPPSKAKTVK